MAQHTEARFGRQDATTAYKAAGKRSYRIRAGGRIEMKLENHKRLDVAYHVFPLSTDFGRAAFRLHKLDGLGTVYDVLVGDGGNTCSCPAGCWTDRPCKHVAAVLTLLDLGVLRPAPGSAGGEEAA